MNKIKVLLMFIVIFLLMDNCLLLASVRQTLMYKQKKDFVNLNIMIEEPYNSIAVVVRCVDCKNYENVIKRMKNDGWTNYHPQSFESVGAIWIDSTNQIDTLINGVDPGTPYSLDTFISMLNKKIFLSGKINIIGSISSISTSLFKKITNFKKYGENFVPEIVKGYEYLRLEIVTDEQEDMRKNREIQRAHKNLVSHLTGKLIKEDGKLGWRKGIRGNNVVVIQLYYELDTLNISTDVFNGKKRDMKYQKNCEDVIKYLAKDIRNAGHTGIVNGVYIGN